MEQPSVQSEKEIPVIVTKGSFGLEPSVFVIGGAQIYAQALPLCDEFYLTRVFHAYQGDTCFPRWDEREWEIIDSESFASGKEFPYPFAFEHYRRRK